MSVLGGAVRVAVATLGVAYGLGSVPAAAQAIPDAYIGVWKNMEGQAGSCSHSDWDGPNHVDTHIRVTPVEFHFHEGICRVTAVETRDGGDQRVTLSCASEGETYQASEIWSLEDRGGQRTLVAKSLERKDSVAIAYQHCPE